MIKKEFAKIGKQIIRQLSSTVEKYKDIEDHMDLDAHGNPTIKTVAEHHRLSKSQISQLIFYHFLHVDERGIICDVSEKEIAAALNCTVRTVRNNNVVLAETELISYSRSGKGINICIVPYPQYFEEHGFGFMELEYTRFEEFILIENVNALRLELRKELVYDNDTIKRQFNPGENTSKISFNDYKIFTPKYTHYKGMMQKIAETQTSAFKTVVQGSTIFFVLKDGAKNGKMSKQEKKDQYDAAIRRTIEETFVKLSGHSTDSTGIVMSSFQNEDIADLVQLSFEYGIERVKSALYSLIEQAFFSHDAQVVENYGGKIRTLIRKELSKNLQDQVPAELTAS
ncbi:hypothetical protein J8N01_14085 [Priestia megaterium]|uniref:hypothetical protein n=1 Tax=Priestia megaterium TaxID=1404 RepID=UPI0006FECAC8|nr:hypothetical protein [Priestia megaterium]KQU11884.1 hypothetical protein ASG61_15385 [Bacillus sp. Leaf75]WDM36221.1 hypothetical protein J8N01_14085 [Priestia megaterium]